MMKILLLISTIFILNGCGDKEPKPRCPEPVCEFPTLPTYKVPPSRKISVKPIDANRSLIKNDDLIELVRNNTRMRRICSNYAVINKRVNEKYAVKKINGTIVKK